MKLENVKNDSPKLDPSTRPTTPVASLVRRGSDADDSISTPKSVVRYQSQKSDNSKPLPLKPLRFTPHLMEHWSRYDVINKSFTSRLTNMSQHEDSEEKSK